MGEDKIRRTYMINCKEPRRSEDEPCSQCELPLRHHGVRFELLNHDPALDVFTLYPVQQSPFNPNVSQGTRISLVRASGKVFGKFTVYA